MKVVWFTENKQTVKPKDIRPFNASIMQKFLDKRPRNRTFHRKMGESERVKKESDITRKHRISQVDTECNYLSHTLWLCVQTV